MDCSLPGSSVHGILQARILEWVAIFFSRVSSWPRNQIWVPCTADRFFTDWAMKEAPFNEYSSPILHCFIAQIVPALATGSSLRLGLVSLWCASSFCFILFYFIFWHCRMLQASPVFLCCSFQFSSVQSLSHVKLCDSMDCSMLGFPVHHHSQSLLKLMRIESVMPSNHLILCHPFLLLLSIFPNIRVIFNESVLCNRWPNIGASASASVPPVNIQGWFPLYLTGLISLQSNGLSRVFFSTTVQKHKVCEGDKVIRRHL